MLTGEAISSPVIVNSSPVNPAFAGGGGVKRPHFFRRVITPVWRGAAALNFG